MLLGNEPQSNLVLKGLYRGSIGSSFEGYCVSYEKFCPWLMFHLGFSASGGERLSSSGFALCTCWAVYKRWFWAT